MIDPFPSVDFMEESWLVFGIVMWMMDSNFHVAEYTPTMWESVLDQMDKGCRWEGY